MTRPHAALKGRMLESKANARAADAATAPRQGMAWIPGGTFAMGAADFYPEELRVRSWLFETWRQVARSFGYEEYDACVLESEEPVALTDLASAEGIAAMCSVPPSESADR